MRSQFLALELNYSDFLLRHNDLDELCFKEWIFHPGMLFGARAKWWSKSGTRDRPHEGLDIRSFRNLSGQIHHLDGNTKIPVMYDGEVLKVSDDFLGKSIYVSHEIFDSKGNQLCTIYGHTMPNNNVQVGKTLKQSEVLATVSEMGQFKAPPHLHITLAWLPQSLPAEAIDWSIIGNPSIITLLDPLEFIGGKHIVTDST